MPPSVEGHSGRTELRPDCSRCFGLCCVAPAFSVSADFALDKPAGRPCPNLAPDHRCAIHPSLRAQGFPGCAAYDCFGAGQRIAQATFGGRDWRSAPGTARQMFAAFGVMRQLHELLWYLTEAEALTGAEALPGAELLAPRLAEAREATETMASGDAARLVALDLDAHRRGVNETLVAVSVVVRGARGGLGPDRRGALLMGADLRRQDLRNASLRGALLVGANLQGLDLGAADLTGADLRGADLRGAGLGACLFVTQSQIDSARGDTRTRIPAGCQRPTHWD
ncbi:MAG TPA: pentapeptide repeat-containing protein [Actinomycetota bacterium]|nr:pentapeptide repeat-containing protein [Actinomycetota bacterium]